MTAVESFMATTEKYLNYAGYIPIGVCTISGSFRCLIGIVQAIAGLFFGLIAKGTSCFKRTEINQAKWDTIAGHCYSHILHGLANILRGSLETIPGAGLTLYFVMDRNNRRMRYICETNF